MRRRTAARACLAACLPALLLGPAPARAQDQAAGREAAEPAPEGATTLPRTLAGMAGTWDLSREGGPRRCTITLTAESGPAGRILRFPAGCRRALPILGGVAGWLFLDGRIRLVDANVRPVLAFAGRPDGRGLGAVSASGEAYDLAPIEIAAMRPKPAEAVGSADAGGARAIPGSQPVLPAATLARPTETPVPGTYALDRYSEKDVCRLDLAEGTGGTDPAPVRILEGCRDAGLPVFDPVSWRYANGHMTLKAKRGHVVNLVPTGDGRWRRDPEIGTTFVLRRVGP